MSPLDINSHPYPTMPMTDDTMRSATYAGFALNTGGANENQRDVVVGGSFHIHEAHRFGNFQAYYGAGLNLGNYHISQLAYDTRNIDTTIGYHYPQSDRFYGGFGLNGGINLVIPFGNGRGEWRVFGVETSFQQEFGQFLHYRKSFPDSTADVLATYDHQFTLGGMTEFVGRTSHGTEIGYKVAGGAVLFPNGHYSGYDSYKRPYYFSNTLHVTKRRTTGFLQFNVGLYAASFQFGINYKLTRGKR
jgi:hypothetical protein